MHQLKGIIVVIIGTVFMVQLAGSSGGGDFTKEELKQLRNADYYFEMTDYHSALNIYREVYDQSKATPELNYKVGVCIFQLREQRPESTMYFEQAEKEGHIESKYYLARCYHLAERFDEAVNLYQAYRNSKGPHFISDEEVDRFIDISMRAKAVTEHPVGVTIENMGESINSRFQEYVPLISADESVLIFTSRREGSTGGKLDPNNEFFEDVYLSVKVDGEWSEPRSIGPNINTETHDACVGLSSGGNLLLLYRTNEDLSAGDLYWSRFENGSWQDPVKFGPEVNSDYQEPSATISDDGITMYFSSDRPGGYGGKDIYRIIKFGNGDWSLPLNLGDVVNTPLDDDAPFIHPDGRSLYFSSTGHETMGGYDIFSTELNDKNTWTEPVNMGYPINTVDDDLFFVLSTDSKRGYYSSGKEGGYGKHDIYMLRMPEASPKLTVIKGKITSADSTARVIKAKITLIDDELNKIQGVYRSNAFTGKYILVFPPEKRYKMLVEATDYFTHTEYVILPERERGGLAEITKEIKLRPKNMELALPAIVPEYKYSYTLENVYFHTQEHHLIAESYGAFTSLIKALLANPKMTIEIAGHTDDVGDEEYNLKLSQRRANAVKTYLQGWGITEDRMTAKGYGEMYFIASNKTGQGRALNRRTEIRVINE